ncbi:MAG: TetR/AcrR family transcriptional regulator [Solirubrobacterales bacterium]
MAVKGRLQTALVYRNAILNYDHPLHDLDLSARPHSRAGIAQDKQALQGPRTVCLALSEGGPLRQQILNTTVQVAATHGCAELTVTRVVERAGIGRSTFYEHFPDIGSCFRAALDEIAAVLLSRIESIVIDSSSDSRAMRLLQPLLDLAIEDEAAARCLFLESLASGPPGLDRRDALCESVAQALAQAWSGREGLRPGARAAAVTVVGGVARLLAIRLQRGGIGADGELAEGLRLWIRSYVPGDGGEAWAPVPARTGGSEPPSPTPEITPRPLPRGRHRLSRDEVARDQRQRILAATADLSREHGYASLTVAQITGAARVSRNAFYAQFRDRAHAATEANELFFQQAMTAAARAFFTASEWPERVWMAGGALLDYIAAHPSKAHLSFVECHAMGPDFVGITYERLDAFTLFLEEGYRRLPAERELSHVASEALAAVMFELTYRELRQAGTAAGLPDLLPGLAYTILAPFIGAAEAARFVRAADERGSS